MIDYIEPVFRPPSEAHSLILQVTNGCSWNNCTFCDMYTAEQKRFRPKAQADLDAELMKVAKSNYQIKRIFLADGDAMTLSYRRLEGILLAIKKYLPDVQRVSSYCLPRNLKNKSVDELRALRELGLQLMYVGCETGDDEILERVQKGETFDTSLDALLKIHQAGMKSSVMVLNGMGGELLSEQHALRTAELMNQSQPTYLSTLVVTFPMGDDRYQKGFDNHFTPLGKTSLFKEMEMLLDTLTLEKTIFRSDHASNYLVLKGTLNQDKDKLLQIVRTAINEPGVIPLRQEWQRGL